jgi:dienelactone hydrolase
MMSFLRSSELAQMPTIMIDAATTGCGGSPVKWIKRKLVRRFAMGTMLMSRVGGLMGALPLVLLGATDALAEIQTEVVEYQHGDVVLEGYLAYDDAIAGERPAVVVVHEWTGLGDYVRSRTEELAELGYVAFAIDMYGQGIRPTTVEEAAEQATIYRSDRQLMRDRANAGLQWLIDHELSDDDQVAAIGYCFGGGTVLELARSGAPLDGVVSFHGNLDTPDPSDADAIQGRVLVLHGAADPLVPDEQIDDFMAEMAAAEVDWQMVFYGGAVHSFTNPDADNANIDGVAYDPEADARSWAAMQQFFNEIFE